MPTTPSPHRGDDDASRKRIISILMWLIIILSVINFGLVWMTHSSVSILYAPAH